MECNKDEAIRARSIAEKKMEKNDFEGARKIVLKAKSLYPGLDNISQLISICDVHCSAQNRLGSEKDWYGILQVERLADESIVKKQYRRLALSLHPDKNRFPGAEGAFKLICEANTVLSDPTKKSAYDSRIRYLLKSGFVNPPSHHPSRSSQFKNTNSGPNNISNGFSSLNQHQGTHSTPSVAKEVFWTCCPYCGAQYQYLRQHIMRSLRCQRCSKAFVGHEIGACKDSQLGQTGAQHMPSKPDLSKPAASREKDAPNQVNLKTGIQNDKGPSALHDESQGTSGKPGVKPKLGNQTGGGSEGIRLSDPPNSNVVLKANEMNACNTKSFHGVKDGETSNGDAFKRKPADVKNKNKRGRKSVESSSESFDSSSESDVDVTRTGNLGGAANENSEFKLVRSPRRSSRKRQRVSYNEADEDGLTSLKRVQATNASREKAQKVALNNRDTKRDKQKSFPNHGDLPNGKQMGNAHPEESLQQRNAGSDKGGKAREETDGKSDTAANTHETKTDFDKDPFSTDDVGTVSCPDPEFSDFDKVRDEKCFAANQFWACYDTLDGMPRFYAKVKKVCKKPFNLIITWLEAVPIDNAFVEWVNNELPAGCGMFKFGETQDTSVRLSFSHQVQCERGKKKGSLIIYPREGEVWALFKDWSTGWASDPEKHKEEFKYEIVEVLSDFVAGTGIQVCYLDKVGGFVSLFKRANESEDNVFLIKPDELYKFSHPVPSSKMTGTEREGVPVGSFELDPAAIPAKPENLYYPSKAKVEHRNTAVPN